MKVDIKNDGRIHYTGIMAKDSYGEHIFINEWSDRGEWEQIDLKKDEVVVGVHGYLHMDW